MNKKNSYIPNLLRFVMTMFSFAFYCFSMEDLSFLPELPTGPLDVYRNNSSFNWKRLKLALEGDLELLKLKVKKYDTYLVVDT